MPKIKLLFVCTYNVMRSRMAASLFSSSTKYEVKSAGIAIHPEFPEVTLITQNTIDWADQIIVMEDLQKHILQSHWNVDGNGIRVLAIPNNYLVECEDHQEALMTLLRDKLADLLS